MCHNEPDLRCVLGLMWVCALAVYTDMIPTRTLGKAKPVKMVTINRLFTEVSERWIDPLVSYHVLMEVSLVLITISTIVDSVAVLLAV